MNPAQKAKFAALLARATHESTPVEEARTSAMILCRLIVASGGFPDGASAGDPSLAQVQADLRHANQARVDLSNALKGAASELAISRAAFAAAKDEIARLRNQASTQAPAQAAPKQAKWINVRFHCSCKKCGRKLAPGERAYWIKDSQGSRVECCAVNV